MIFLIFDNQITLDKEGHMNTGTLPIHKHRDEIIAMLQDHQVVIIVGETGSGKTTQLPLFLNIPEYTEHTVIGMTEPRRIAVTSTARFVAKQLNAQLGQEVGYAVRHDYQSDGNEDIFLMTEGILIRELQKDGALKKYSVLILDEAHERSMNLDLIMGCLKRILPQEHDLRVIISSATINAEKFSDYFDNAPIINVSGRTFPVTIHYDSCDYDSEPQVKVIFGKKEITPPPYVPAIADRVERICEENTDGDILIFVPGIKEIEWTTEAINEKKLRNINVIQLYGNMKMEDQDQVFNVTTTRKVIVSTNIAETSLTIDGVVYVIDSGFIKQKGIDPHNKINTLRVVEHAQAGCNQRAGRAGRTQPGICYRLFTESNFNNRIDFTIPEIQRSNLENVVLDLLSLNIKDVRNFPFLDPPKEDLLNKAINHLKSLGAITNDESLTPLGEKMARLPLPPNLAKMIIMAEQFGVVNEALTIAAMLSTRQVFIIPRDKSERQKAEARWTLVKDHRSDIMTFLKIWNKYNEIYNNPESDVTAGKWAFNHFLNNKVLQEVRNVRHQLTKMLNAFGIEISSSDNDDAIHQCYLSAFPDNVCIRGGGQHSYLDRNRETIFIQPGSVFFFTKPGIVVGAEKMKSGRKDSFSGQLKTYLRHVAPLKVEWLPELFPERVKEKVDLYSMQYNSTTQQMLVRTSITWDGLNMGSQNIPWSSLSINSRKELQPQDVAYYFKQAILRTTMDTLMELHQIPNRDHYQVMIGKWFDEAINTTKEILHEEELSLTKATKPTLKEIFRAVNARLQKHLKEQYQVELQRQEAIQVEYRERLTELKTIVLKTRKTPYYQFLATLNSSLGLAWLRIERITQWERNDKLHKQTYLNRIYWLNDALDDVPRLIRQAKHRLNEQEEMRKREAEALHRQQQHKDVCNSHLQSDDWSLCPVCTEFMTITANGDVSCKCHSDDIQIQFAFQEKDTILLMESRANNKVVATLTAVRDKNDKFVLKRTVTSDIFLTNESKISMTYHWEAPNDNDLEIYRHNVMYYKKKKAAIKLVHQGDAILLSFKQGRNAKGFPQWQSSNGTVLYVMDRQSKLTPSSQQRQFFCTIGDGLGKQGSRRIILVKPFLINRR